MDIPIPGLERAGRLAPERHKDLAEWLGKNSHEWEFTSYSNGSYTLTYLCDAGPQLLESNFRWGAGDIDFEQGHGKFTVSIRRDDNDYSEVAVSVNIADDITVLEDAITILTRKLTEDHIISG